MRLDLAALVQNRPRNILLMRNKFWKPVPIKMTRMDCLRSAKHFEWTSWSFLYFQNYYNMTIPSRVGKRKREVFIMSFSLVLHPTVNWECQRINTKIVHSKINFVVFRILYKTSKIFDFYSHAKKLLFAIWGGNWNSCR